MQTVEIDGVEIEVPVDLIVPEGIAAPGGTRGARLGVHGRRAARKAPGLEAAIVDNDVLAIASLDQDDPRMVDALVAGPTALLIAKAHKINDRLVETDRPDRLKDKDASDVYRIFLTTPNESVRCCRACWRTSGSPAQPSGGSRCCDRSSGRDARQVWRWPFDRFASPCRRTGSAPCAPASSTRWVCETETVGGASPSRSRSANAPSACSPTCATTPSPAGLDPHPPRDATARHRPGHAGA